MRKFVTVIDDQSPIKPLYDEVHAKESRFKERHEFLTNQMKNLIKDATTESQDLWKKMTALMRARGILPPDFNESKWHFHTEGEKNEVIFICDCGTI